MVKNTKTWISWERNIIFLRNKKILNLCLRWHILRSYHFVAEVTLKYLLEIKIPRQRNFNTVVSFTLNVVQWSFRGQSSLDYFRNSSNQNPMKTIFFWKRIDIQFWAFLNWICTMLYIIWFYQQKQFIFCVPRDK